jgi:hypothetical protein
MNKPNTIEQGKTISINALPDCDYKDLMLSIVSDPSAKICVVAFVAGNVHQPLGELISLPWQARASYPHESDLKSFDEIGASHHLQSVMCNDVEGTYWFGTALPEKVARILFPDWDRTYLPALAEEQHHGR